MLKFLAFLAVITLLAWIWAAFRRRLKLAFKVAAVVYGVGALVRLSYVGINEDRAFELSLVTLAFVAFWALIWLVTFVMGRRRKLKTDQQKVTS